MSSGEHAFVLVYSTNHAIRIDKLLARAGIACKLVPVPRHLSSDCGVCVRIGVADVERTLAALEAAQVEYEGVYRV